MLRWRWLGLRAPLPVVGLALLAMAAGVVSAPTTRASGPGPCATITSADKAQHALTMAGGVTARLSRTQGTVGTELTATGAGWPAGATVLVDVYIKRNGAVFAEAPLTQAVVSANGTFTTAQFLAPRSVVCSSLSETSDGRPTDGGSMLLLIHTRDGKARALVTFTYLTYDLGPWIIPASAGSALAPGTALAFTGAHWEPGEQVTLTPMAAPGSFTLALFPPPSAFQPVPGLAVSATADENGAFSAVVPGFDEPPGTLVEVIAQGTGPRYGTVSVSNFIYQMLPKIFPSIHLSEIAVNAGGALTVTGDHWPANVAGVIEYCRGETTLPDMVGLRCLGGQHLGDYQTDSAGRFSATVHMPTNAALGSVTVQARIPNAPFGLAVYAAAQPLAIAPTFAQAHPRLMRLSAVAPYLAASAVGVVVLLIALLLVVRRRQRRNDT